MSVEKLMPLADRQVILDEWALHLRDNLANPDEIAAGHLSYESYQELARAYESMLAEIESGDLGKMSDEAINARMAAFENEKRDIILGVRQAMIVRR